MMGNGGISVADALALRNSGNSGDGTFGGDGWWIVLLILLFAGGRGYGFGNDGIGGNGGYSACCTPATAQGVSDAFNFNQLDNGLRSIERGLCDGFYTTATGLSGVTQALQSCCCDTQMALANGFNGVQQGFCGIDKSIMQGNFYNQSGFNALANQLASCCCDIGRGQDSIKYALEKDVNALLVANEKNTDRILNYLTQTENEKLRTELQSAQFQLSQLSQTSNIVNQLMPVAKPAYLTCSPYAAAFGFPTVGYNSGCGCGCA